MALPAAIRIAGNESDGNTAIKNLVLGPAGSLIVFVLHILPTITSTIVEYEKRVRHRASDGCVLRRKSRAAATNTEIGPFKARRGGLMVLVPVLGIILIIALIFYLAWWEAYKK